MKDFLKVILFISIIIFIENKAMKYRCGTNDLKIKPKVIKPKFTVNKDNPSYKRKLDDVDEDGFKKFNIYVDKYNIKKEIARNYLEDYQDLILESLDKAANTLQNLLRVRPLSEGIQFSNTELNDLNLISWDFTKFGSRAIIREVDLKSLDIDLVIFSTIEEMDEEVIAAAAPIYNQESNHQPILGMVYINYYIDFEKVNIQKYLETTLIHEITHVLGFTGEFFEEYFHNIVTKTDKFGIKRQYINSPKVLEVARKYFNCPTIEGVELENYGDDGTVGSHWEARILLGDYMNGVAYTEEVISEFSLALLEDTGIYKPYYYTGGLMRYGKNKGCEFVYDKCVNDDYKINNNFENEFFDNIYSEFAVDASCSSGRISRAYNTLYSFGEPLPMDYQYFKDETVGGWGAADYCPLPGSSLDEEVDAYYPGICSNTETGIYGSQIFYDDEDDFYANAELAQITGEVISNQSFCFLSSLYQNDIDEVDKFSKVVRANCYEIFCSEKSLTVQINADYIVCPRSGGKIKVDGYEGYLLCPDYNLMCSGTVICNDMFDCVDKKSEIKPESYEYDYEIKTSQSIAKAEASEEEDSTNYELSDNGVCPKYCKHCYENNECLKCKEDYNLVYIMETDEIICIHKDELTVGYLVEDDIYYKCIDNCDKCSDIETCDQCKEGIEYNTDFEQCININIENCLEEDEDGICEKCDETHAFNDTDRNFCIKKESFNNEYFTEDNGTSYVLCSSNISGCDTCQYNPNNQNLKCNKCKTGYALYNEENECLLKEEIDKNKNYFYTDEFNVKKCSDALQNCLKCTNGSICITCMNNNYFINNNKTACVGKYKINSIESYYMNDELNAFLSCDKYNSIDKCIECSSENTCNKCEDGYEYKEEKCVKINREKYIKFSNFSLLYFIVVILIVL